MSEYYDKPTSISVKELRNRGYIDRDALKALEKTNDDVEKAEKWLKSNKQTFCSIVVNIPCNPPVTIRCQAGMRFKQIKTMLEDEWWFLSHSKYQYHCGSTCNEKLNEEDFDKRIMELDLVPSGPIIVVDNQSNS